MFLSHLLSHNLLISDELFITKDLGVRKAQLEEVLRFIIPIPKHDTLQYGFQSRNNKQRNNIQNNLMLIFYSLLYIYKYKNRTYMGGDFLTCGINVHNRIVSLRVNV